MKLILTQAEIEQILRDHILQTVTLVNGSDFTIDFVATRGDAGVTATVDIPYLGLASLPAITAEAEPTPAPAAPVKRAAPIAAAPTKVKAKIQDEAESSQDPQEEAQDAAGAPFDEPASADTSAAQDSQDGEKAPAKGPSLFS